MNRRLISKFGYALILSGLVSFVGEILPLERDSYLPFMAIESMREASP